MEIKEKQKQIMINKECNISYNIRVYIYNFLSEIPAASSEKSSQKTKAYNFFLTTININQTLLVNKIKLAHMTDTKITFPKLKCFSERQTVITNKTTNTNLKTLSSQQPKTQMYGQSLQERLNNLKVKYVNKSPNYFKRINRSLQTIQDTSENNKTIEKYLQEKSRIFDKETLLQVARSRVKKIRLQQYDVMKREKELSQNDVTIQENETKYSNFRPSRFPIKHAIKSMHHQDLTLPIRL